LGIHVSERVLELMEAEGIHKTFFCIPDPSFFRMLVTAEKRGWQVVAPHHEEALTPAGEEVARRVLAARAETLQGALDALAPGDRAAFARLAEQVLEGFITGRRHAAATCRMSDAHACGHYEGRCPVTRGADRAGEGAAPSPAH